MDRPCCSILSGVMVGVIAVIVGDGSHIPRLSRSIAHHSAAAAIIIAVASGCGARAFSVFLFWRVVGCDILGSWCLSRVIRASGRGGCRVKWAGRVSGMHLGVDVRVGDEVPVGAVVSQLVADMGFGAGDYDVRLDSLGPYLGWRFGGVRGYVTVGGGGGCWCRLRRWRVVVLRRVVGWVCCGVLRRWVWMCRCGMGPGR